MGAAKRLKAQNKKMYTAYIDLTAAFDVINRKKLIEKLIRMGIPTKITNLIIALYKHTKMIIWDGNQLSESFETKRGVKQGCILSPLLFSLFTADLPDQIKGGDKVSDTVKINCTMYADDIALTADSAESENDAKQTIRLS